MPENNEIQLRSEEVQDILTRVPHWMIRWGSIVILAIFLMVFVLSWVIRYPDVLPAEIIITTQVPPEKLVSKTTGRIEKILVSDRASIQAKTPLAVIENTADYHDVFLLKNITDSLDINAVPFRFPFEKLPALQLGDIESAFAIFEKDYLAYKLNRDLKPYQVEGSAQNYEVSQVQERLSLLQQQKALAQSELILRKKDLDRYQKLYEKGIISNQEWEIKSIDYLQQEKNMRSLNTQISQLYSSRNDLDRNRKTTTINENKEEVTLLRATIQSFQQLRKAIADWELAYVLRSSIAGEVSFLQIWKENQTITAGENVFSIIPKDDKNYIGKLRASIRNSGKLKTGQDVNIRLANYPDREFGVLRGKVKSISLTADKDGFLLIDVSLPKGLETSYKKRIAFQQEMSGTADIITEDLRLIERLLYQFRDIFRR